MSSSKGSKMPRRDRKVIMNMNVPIFENNIEKKLTDILIPTLNLISENNRQIEELIDFRKSGILTLTSY